MPEISKKRRHRSRSNSPRYESPEHKKKKKKTDKDNKRTEKDSKNARRGSRSRSRSRSDKKDKIESKTKKRSRSREKSKDRQRKKSKENERKSDRSSRKSSKERRVHSSRDAGDEKLKSHHHRDSKKEEREKVADILSSGKSQQDIQKDLEAEMQKRREKVAEWRTKTGAVSCTEQSVLTSESSTVKTEVDIKSEPNESDQTVSSITQGWSLENDDEDDDYDNTEESGTDSKTTDKQTEDVKPPPTSNGEVDQSSQNKAVKEEVEEIDPLDEYMMGIEKAVKLKWTEARNINAKTEGVSNMSSLNKSASENSISDQVSTSTCISRKTIVVKKTVVATPTTALLGKQSVKGVDATKKLPLVPTSGSKTNKATREMSELEKKRGVVIEQGQDALEYSSEEEKGASLSELNATSDHKRLKLMPIDHSKVQYEPFTKAFYVEVPEIAKMTKAEVAAYRENELDGTKVKGNNCPKPIKSWVQAGVSKSVLSVLKKNKYEAPTPIQAQALPVIMSGRDMLGVAQTGCGKTLAFLIPMFRHVLDQPFLEEGDGPIAVLLTPTRELAMQTFKECKKFAKVMNLRVACVYGGTGISEQIAELKVGCEIIVCTPGRMIDMLAANNGRVTNLRRCTYCVLDEADRMFDMGFEPQVMRIMDNMRPDRQTVMFSATFPRQMETLARRILDNPIEISVGGRSVVCSDIEQNVVIMEDEDIKFYKLLELLGLYSEKGSSLVFVERQEDADKLLKKLMDASYSCLALHGGLDQYDRDSVIHDFRMGVCTLLIATSVAARGLDVRSLYLVVNYDCPSHYEDYVHRVGRTGRAGNKGIAYTFLTTDQGKLAGDVVKAFQLAKTEVPQELMKLWDDFVAEQKALGKEVYRTGGFGGKGFKFDETEKEIETERKKLQKISHGVGAGGESEDEEDQIIESKIEQMFETRKSVKNVEPSAEEKAALIEQYKLAEQAHKTLEGPVIFTGNHNIDNKMKQARELALKMIKNPAAAIQQHQVSKFVLEMNDVINRPPCGVVVNTPVTNSNQNTNSEQSFLLTANAFLRTGTVASASNTSKSVAEQVAEKLNRKLNYQGGGNGPNLNSLNSQSEIDAHMMTKYEEELEINDFPATARFKVLSRETLTHLAEYSDCMITVKGQYYPSGHNPPEGERKLFLAIESIHERGVAICKAELVRIIKEELLRLQTNQGTRQQGRYRVV